MQTINYLPLVLQDIREFKVITSCDDVENSEINICIEKLYNDQFISTTEKAIKRYEDMLGIVSKGTDTLEDRQFRILAVYNKQLPYTKTVLERNLANFCGNNGYHLNLDYVNKILTVKITLIAKSMFNTVKDYLEAVIPLNLIVELSLLYNQNKMFTQYAHEELKKWTHNQLREEVI